MRQARETGHPVAVPDRTTETSQVLANPDGNLVLRTYRRPVRVKRDGAWRDIDTRLTRTPDGSLKPAATTVDVAFSGGGTAPMVTLRQSGRTLTLSWPRPLPAPTVDGDTANYPGVLPGVDLRLTAKSDSYSQVLVVHDAAAAAQPELDRIGLTAAGTGVELAARADGGLTATAPDGTEVFAAPAAVMWDSARGNPQAPPPTADDRSTGRVSRVGVELAAGRSDAATSTTELTLVPDTGALRGPNVTYPLYIDPGFGVWKQHWTEVTSNGWHYFDDSDQFAQVGDCDWPECGTKFVARSYFQFDISAVWPRNGRYPAIWRAQFFITQLWSADHGNCGAGQGQPTEIREAGAIDAGTRWPGPLGGLLNTQYSNAGNTCPNAGLVFDVWTAVRHASDGSWGNLVLGLNAPNENAPLQWKKFDNNPKLEVEYSFPPNPATAVGVSNEVKCDGVTVTPDAQPTLRANATDNNNPALALALAHEIWDYAETTKKTNTADPSSDVISNGATGQWRSPVSLGDGLYKFRTGVYNLWPTGPNQFPTYPNPGNRNLWSGPWSNWYPFWVDTISPASAPAITSTDYPSEYWGAPSGAPGAIQVSTTVSDVVGYTYTFAGSGTEVVPNTADCNYHRSSTTGGWIPHAATGTDWIPVPGGLSPGRHTMHIRSFDRAHNLSPESSYAFYVAPNTGLGMQRLEAEALPASVPAGQNVVPRPIGNCCDVSWSGGAELGFPGNAVGQSFTLAFQTAGDSYYRMGVGLTKNPGQGQLEFRIDGQLIGNPSPGQPPGRFDAYNPRTISSYHPLGNRQLAAGRHTFTVTVVGTNPASTDTRYSASIDFLDLIRTSQYEAEDPSVVTKSQPAGQNVPLAPQTNSDPTVIWSNGAQLRFAADRVNTSFGLDFSVPIDADYALGANLTKTSGSGRLTFALDGHALLNGDTWDGYQASGTGTEYLTLGGGHLSAGKHTLTIKVTGTNASSVSPRYAAGIDLLNAVPINNVTATDFTTAMNNDGIGSDNTTAADLDSHGASLSAQALAAAGYAPGATATINGATFTMPAPRSNGMDNVIAIGQTIPFPNAQRVKATAVGLLVATVSTTCGGAPTWGIATINYTDNTTQDSSLLFGPDWSDTTEPTPDVDVVLPYRNEGTTPNRAIATRLQAVFAPADPTKTVASITLPNFGSDLLPGGCADAQHVFAIAPRPATPGWVGAWTAPVDAAVPPASGTGANQTLRSVVHPTVTGDSIRVRLGNHGSGTPVTFGAVTLAAQAGTDAATLGTPTALTFGGNAAVTIAAGAEVLSDPVPFPTTQGGSGNLTVSMNVTSATPVTPVHSYPTSPAFLAAGNATTNATGTPFTTRLTGIRFLTDVMVSTADTAQGTVAVFGDQLSAIAPPGTTYQPTWVDALPGKLADAGVPLSGGLVNASRAGLRPSGHWRLDDGTGTTARDSSGSTNTTLTSGATWSTERGGAVALNGSTGCLTTAGPVLDTTASFTVSAWVKLNATSTGPQTVVSQDGATNNAFALQYTGTADNKWSFTLPTTSVNGAPPVRVLSEAPARTGAWTHLLGIYDAPNKLAHLFVDGRWQDMETHSTPWPSSGPLAIGRGKSGGAASAFLNGSVSDIRAYQTAIGEYDVSVLYNGSPVPGDQPGGGAVATGWANESLDRTVLNQPALRTVIVSLGANEVIGDYLANPLIDIRANRRTDGTLVHVIVTTIPPLGLADTDPREQERKLFNTDLIANYTDYGADEVIDIAAAVRDPAHPNQIDPAYLTGGVPNAAYHEAIAVAIAAAASSFPPEIRL
ncbi:LamG-like jellyroll fold domain-containing protein [Actinophytocola sp.]|uniref:LamG-like jellyroll fold domain-containing protein n=1 Tax=Actinophytocola sp. TaxID=1872138 RepID=UPI00389ABEA1